MKCRVVIMAGGKGTRLHPITEKTPKPLVKIGSKPVLQTTIEKIRNDGFYDIILSVRYKAELIENYFGDGSRFGVSISYVKEQEELGTAGALGLVDDPGNYVLVTNCDLITDISFRDFLQFHIAKGLPATAAVALHQKQVHYGVVEQSEQGNIVEIREKPIVSMAINAGIYMLNGDVVRSVKGCGYLLMTDFLNRLLPNVAAYPIEGYWMDIGRFEDLGRAQIYSD